MTTLFKHILVPLDFTQKNSAAIEFAVQLAAQNTADVTLLHVIETIEYAADGEIAKFYETLERRAQDNLADCAKSFHDALVPVKKRVVLGKRAHGIVSYALQEEVDMIVMSSHKVNLSDDPHAWATLSHQVSILSQCPVLLVK